MKKYILRFLSIIVWFAVFLQSINGIKFFIGFIQSFSNASIQPGMTILVSILSFVSTFLLWKLAVWLWKDDNSK